MRKEDYKEIRVALETGPVFKQFKDFVDVRFKGKITELLATDSAERDTILALVGELRAINSVIPNFKSFLDEKIRTTENE